MVQRKNLVTAAEDDLRRLNGADWGVEVEIIGQGFLSVQVHRDVDTREVGDGATTSRDRLLIKTPEELDPTWRIRFNDTPHEDLNGLTFRIAGRDAIEGEFSYELTGNRDND